MKNLDQLELTQQGVFELIEFTLNRQLPNGEFRQGLYGINVSKVREVVRMPEINPLSSQIPGVAGVFELRGVPIPAINLAQALGDKYTERRGNQQIIVAEFSNKRAGFVVDQTHRIRRVSWDKVLPPTADSSTCINGMILIEENNFLFILDLEKIISRLEKTDLLNSSQGLSDSRFENSSSQKIPGLTGRVLVVDDSQFIRSNIVNYLSKSGLEIVEAENGVAAQEILLNSQDNPEYQGIQLIVTDVEMPRMDGVSLCTWIKSQEKFKKIPVIMHSSLSGSATQQAAKKAGAEAYVVKSDMKDLLLKVKKHLA